MIDIIKNTWHNLKVPIILGAIGFIVAMCYVTDFDSNNITWFYIWISIVTSGTVGAIVYSIKKYLEKSNKPKDCDAD